MAGAEPARSERTGRATYLRRRVVLVGALVLLVFALTVVLGPGADARLAQRVDGHAVVEPGGTLWDVAVASAPDGADPREQLARIRELNQLDDAEIAAWSVVLLPAW